MEKGQGWVVGGGKRRGKIGDSGEMQGKAGLGKGLGKVGVVREGEKKGVGGDKRGRKMGREGGEIGAGQGFDRKKMPKEKGDRGVG